MMKFKNSIRTMAALLMAAVTFTACTSDDIAADEPQQPAEPATGKYTMTIEASKGGDATTRALSLDGSTLNATWKAGEAVKVVGYNDAQTGLEVRGTIYAQSDGATTTLTGTLDKSIVGDGFFLFFPKYPFDYTGQKGTLADIAANFDYAESIVNEFTVNNNIITTTAPVTFDNDQAIVKFTLKDKSGNALDASSLTIHDENNNLVASASLMSATPGDITITLVGTASEIWAALKSDRTMNLTLTATVGDNTYTYSKSDVKFKIGEFYDITVKMKKQPPVGALAGQFSINADGDKVYFSQGNLQATYDGSAWTWAFAEHQWDYIGGRSEEGSETQTGNNYVTDSSPFISANRTVDLFGWVGASSTWTGVNMYGITSASDDVLSNANGYGNTQTSEGLKADWGTLAISNGGNTSNSGWRTLTKDEWTYLFSTRTVNGGTGSDKSYTIGQSVNGVAGVVIYPDNYTGSVYVGTDWATFEAAGCVFLPAAGYRSKTYVNDAGSFCSYWSSTAFSREKAYYLKIVSNSGYMNTSLYTYRYSGKSVRLVRPVE